MPEPTQESINLARWILSIVIPAIAGLVGVLIGAWLAGKQHREQQKIEFVEKQLKHFYSPLLGIRNEIRMLSELRLKISSSADYHWRKLCGEAREQGGVEGLRQETDQRRDHFMKAIDYNSRQLTEHLLPSYRKMVSVFRDHYYLAEPHTLEYFRPLLEFVDIWDRWMDESIPYEVVEDLGHGEKPLHALYDNIEKTHDDLRSKVSRGKA